LIASALVLLLPFGVLRAGIGDLIAGFYRKE